VHIRSVSNLRSALSCLPALQPPHFCSSFCLLLAPFSICLVTKPLDPLRTPSRHLHLSLVKHPLHPFATISRLCKALSLQAFLVSLLAVPSLFALPPPKLTIPCTSDPSLETDTRVMVKKWAGCSFFHLSSALLRLPLPSSSFVSFTAFVPELRLSYAGLSHQCPISRRGHHPRLLIASRFSSLRFRPHMIDFCKGLLLSSPSVLPYMIAGRPTKLA